MNTYMIKRRTGGAADWSRVPQARLEYALVQPPAPVTAAAQLCWDDAGLYVRLTAREPQILARFTGESDPVCRDSCLELFLCPLADDPRYFNIELNPNGACFFGFGRGRVDLIRLHPWDVRRMLAIEPFREHDLWGVSYCVPQSVIRLFMPGFTLRAGLHMRANFYKCGDDLCPPHELCWSPITNGVTDFHQPAFFGDLYLQ